MEKKRYSGWIIVALVGAAVAGMCGCLLVLGAAVFPWWGVREWHGEGLSGYKTGTVEKTFEVGPGAALEVHDFAGSVTVRPGAEGTLRVVATKRARFGSTLDEIEVNMSQEGDTVVVTARKPGGWSNVSVQFEITAPADTRLELWTGAGSADVSGMTAAVDVFSGAGTVSMENVRAPIQVESGAGMVVIRDASGPVRVRTGAGLIEYEGEAEGTCEFGSGAGSISLRLPRDLDMELDLTTALGSIDVDYDVQGRVSRHEVKGTVGSGDGARITANTAVGAITVEHGLR